MSYVVEVHGVTRLASVTVIRVVNLLSMFKYLLAGLLLPSWLVQCSLESGNVSSWDTFSWATSDRLTSALSVSDSLRNLRSLHQYSSSIGCRDRLTVCNPRHTLQQ